MKEILDAQRQHWQKTFVQKPDMFGAEYVLGFFKSKSKKKKETKQRRGLSGSISDIFFCHLFAIHCPNNCPKADTLVLN